MRFFSSASFINSPPPPPVTRVLPDPFARGVIRLTDKYSLPMFVRSAFRFRFRYRNIFAVSTVTSASVHRIRVYAEDEI